MYFLNFGLCTRIYMVSIRVTFLREARNSADDISVNNLLLKLCKHITNIRKNGNTVTNAQIHIRYALTMFKYRSHKTRCTHNMHNRLFSMRQRQQTINHRIDNARNYTFTYTHTNTHDCAIDFECCCVVRVVFLFVPFDSMTMERCYSCYIGFGISNIVTLRKSQTDQIARTVENTKPNPDQFYKWSVRCVVCAWCMRMALEAYKKCEQHKRARTKPRLQEFCAAA